MGPGRCDCHRPCGGRVGVLRGARPRPPCAPAREDGVPMKSPVPVLMYHSISEHPPGATRRLSVHPEMFAAHLRLLRRSGFSTLRFGDYAARLLADQPLPERAVVLTFD